MFSIVSLTQDVSSKNIQEEKRKPNITLKRKKVKIISKNVFSHKLHIRKNDE